MLYSDLLSLHIVIFLFSAFQDTENWPLLQAFALDNVLCPTGFFTTRYAVADISESLEVQYSSPQSIQLTSI